MDYATVIAAALAELGAAAEKLGAHPLRVRRFEIVPGRVVWPAVENKRLYVTDIKADDIFNLSTRYSCLGNDPDMRSMRTPNKVVAACGYQPRLVLRALRRIQAATAWCEARAEGRKRHAEEILRQQQKAVDALEAEAAMLALKE